MIFEDHSGAAAVVCATEGRRSTHEVLAACVMEAERQAAALGHLDIAVGQALADGDAVIHSQSFQGLDLLRQEAEGLASLLKLVASMPSPEAIIDEDAIVKCVPLAAQRARIAAG